MQWQEDNTKTRRPYKDKKTIQRQEDDKDKKTIQEDKAHLCCEISYGHFLILHRGSTGPLWIKHSSEQLHHLLLMYRRHIGNHLKAETENLIRNSLCKGEY